MTLVNLAGLEPIEVMCIYVGREREESASAVADVVRFVFAADRIALLRKHLLMLLSQRLGGCRVPKTPLNPPLYDLVASMWRGLAVVIEALSPEAPEELWLHT